jgi:hypothetical protein
MEHLSLPERKALEEQLRLHKDEDMLVQKLPFLMDPKKKRIEDRILVIGKHRIYVFRPGGKVFAMKTIFPFATPTRDTNARLVAPHFLSVVVVCRRRETIAVHLFFDVLWSRWLLYIRLQVKHICWRFSMCSPPIPNNW